MKTRSRGATISTSSDVEASLRGAWQTVSVDETDTIKLSSSTGSMSGAGRECVTIAPIAPTLLKTSSTYSSSPSASSIPLPSRTLRVPSPRNTVVTGALEEDENEDGEVPLLWVPPSGYGGDLAINDDDDQTYLLGCDPAIETPTTRRIPGYRIGNWIVTPPTDNSSVVLDNKEMDYFGPRQGRTAARDRHLNVDGRLNVKPNESLSPAETSSSNESSRSRSRGRNRTHNELLDVAWDCSEDAALEPPPSEISRGRSRSRSRSSSSARDDPCSSEGTYQQSEERGRSTVRSPPTVEGARSGSRESSGWRSMRRPTVEGNHTECNDMDSGTTPRPRGRTSSPKTGLYRGRSGGMNVDRTVNDRMTGATLPSAAPPKVSAGDLRRSERDLAMEDGSRGPLAGLGLRGYLGSVWGR